MKPSVTIYSFNDAFAAGEITLRGFIDFAAKIGMEGVELGYYWQDEQRERESVLQWVREAGLVISGYITDNNFVQADEGERREQIEKVKRAVDSAKALGTDLVRVFAGRGPEGSSFEADRHLVVESLKQCVDYAAPLGVRVALEDHGGIAATSEHLLYYRDQVDSENFGFVVDIGNFLASGGEDPLSAVQRVASGTLLIHIKDGIRQEDGTWIPHLCGEGQVPMEECLEALHESGYDGYASIEYEVPVHYAEGLPKEAAFVRSLLEKITGNS